MATDIGIAKSRAAPLAPDDRRAAIIDAVIPLILEHGSEITTRQIAQAAGVAEGTLFRAFGDKDSIIDAAVERFFDPEPLRRQVAAVDQGLPLRDKIEFLLTLLQERTKGVMNILGALGPRSHRPRSEPGEEFVELLTTVLGSNAAQLRVDIVDIAYYLRLLALASSIQPFNEPHPFTTAQLTDLIVGGISKD
jgi:AcrR family transcriptional regulator